MGERSITTLLYSPPCDWYTLNRLPTVNGRRRRTFKVSPTPCARSAGQMAWKSLLMGKAPMQLHVTCKNLPTDKWGKP
jgi:hypothetical protein